MKSFINTTLTLQANCSKAALVELSARRVACSRSLPPTPPSWCRPLCGCVATPVLRWSTSRSDPTAGAPCRETRLPQPSPLRPPLTLSLSLLTLLPFPSLLRHVSLPPPPRRCRDPGDVRHTHTHSSAQRRTAAAATTCDIARAGVRGVRGRASDVDHRGTATATTTRSVRNSRTHGVCVCVVSVGRCHAWLLSFCCVLLPLRVVVPPAAVRACAMARRSRSTPMLAARSWKEWRTARRTCASP